MAGSDYRGVSRVAKLARGFSDAEFSLFDMPIGVLASVDALRSAVSAVNRGSKLFAFCLSDAMLDDGGRFNKPTAVGRPTDPSVADYGALSTLNDGVYSRLIECS